ncbi:MAG: thiopurine S-methyltransferase [Planctomycetota bacterium]
MHEHWLQRWEDGHIGWHRDLVHPALTSHWPARGTKVLVPLCGKSIDLCWLADQGHQVTGIELAERAVRAFFAEQNMPHDVVPGALPAWRAQSAPITLHCGDYFAYRQGGFEAHYDRGALVALPPSLRPAYAKHTTSLLAANAEQLVVTVEYDSSIADGPPYAIPPSELQRYWPQLECVERREILAEAPPKFRAAGLTSVIEAVWRTRLNHGF